MTANDWTPPADDVEAAAKALCLADNLGDPREWDAEDDRLRNVYRKLARIAMTTAHARGWRDASEVAALERHRDDLSAHMLKAQDNADEAFARVVAERDAARAEGEAMRKAISYAQTVMGEAGYDNAAPIEALARAAVKVAADRDALDERCRVAERERDLAVAHDRQPYPTADAYEKVCAARHRAEARAAKLEAALKEICEPTGRSTYKALEHVRTIARAALTPTADTDGSKT